jgi:hypothetical protein
MDLNELMKNPEQIKSLIQVLQTLLPEAAENSKEDSSGSEEEFSAPIKTRGSKTRPKQTKNKFNDMPEHNMHKEDVAIDKKLAKFPPVSRARQFEMVEVKCRVCGRTETVSPSLVFEGLERYKCNNCSTSAG